MVLSCYLISFNLLFYLLRIHHRCINLNLNIFFLWALLIKNLPSFIPIQLGFTIRRHTLLVPSNPLPFQRALTQPIPNTCASIHHTSPSWASPADEPRHQQNVPQNLLASTPSRSHQSKELPRGTHWSSSVGSRLRETGRWLTWAPWSPRRGCSLARWAPSACYRIPKRRK